MLTTLQERYQNGYLTIDHRDEDGLYHLVFPNYEVRESLQQYLLLAGKPVVAVAISFSSQTRNIDGWEMAEFA